MELYGSALSLLVFFAVTGQRSYCVMPRYLPALNPSDADGIEGKIREYFSQGFSNAEILGFLVAVHGFTIGLRTLKRRLKRMGLKRVRQNAEAPLHDIVSAIHKEMEGYVGSSIGYRDMTMRLRLKHNLTVRRDTVMRSMRVIDPDGVQSRKRHRLKRRKYVTPGPNFIWHLDGWDKLKPYGFSVHTCRCMDGFSRRLVWLEVGSTNKNPKVTVNYFLDAVDQLGGVPRMLRTDRGNENVWISVMQKLFRMDCGDDLAVERSVIEGKSSANQRIEAYWSKLRQGGGGWWMSFFKDLRDSGIFADHDPLHKECLKFCFMPILRKKMYSVAKLWNIKEIHTKKEFRTVGWKARRDVFLPEAYGARSYLISVDREDVEVCKTLYGQNVPDCSSEFSELVELIYRDYSAPGDTEQALKLFIEITGLLHHSN